MMPFLERDEHGFSLIEFIATLVIVTIVGAMMFQYFGTSLTASSEPVHRLTEALALQQTLENMTEEYNASDKSENYLDATLKTNMGAEGSDQNNTYGEYHVVDNHFIKFVAQVETPIAGGDPKNVLKVTIRDALGETLTVLFTAQ
jgi:prepilin-type N-terminal cleavage/methylation domain-containing protein